MATMTNGYLASRAGYMLPLQVLESGAGYYIGTCDEGGPVSRESVEYFPDAYTAHNSLVTGMWTQREHA